MNERPKSIGFDRPQFGATRACGESDPSATLGRSYGPLRGGRRSLSVAVSLLAVALSGQAFAAKGGVPWKRVMADARSYWGKQENALPITKIDKDGEGTVENRLVGAIPVPHFLQAAFIYYTDKYGARMRNRVLAQYQQVARQWRFLQLGWGEVNELSPATKLPPAPPVPPKDEITRLLMEKAGSVLEVVLGTSAPKLKWRAGDKDDRYPTYLVPVASFKRREVERGTATTYLCKDLELLISMPRKTWEANALMKKNEKFGEDPPFRITTDCKVVSKEDCGIHCKK